MAIFKCKMCGGTIEFEQGATVGVCDSCGTKQTLPRLDNDRKQNLYDRANHFRRNNEYDKAAGIYEQILNEDTSDAEAYWSLVLCCYGIEYVEDPSSHKRVPTMNRTQFTSIFDNDNYKSAIQYADEFQRTIYEEEAAAINEIQKGILAISNSEKPFDVFICYKETDANGERTQDSVLANDLYHQLTQEGFNVFFSRITLEDKLGTAYEPYIFAALNSAKVMVVLGTKPEYFNAVWVKNEWSRYLALVKQSEGKKTLIPAYKNMDPYDLPEEFSHLQAQDMSKLGFMQDLIRGIKKLTSDVNAANYNESVAGANVSVESLIDRVVLLIEDRDYEKANEIIEQLLSLAPKHPMIYVCKLMIENNVTLQDDLAKVPTSFESSPNYIKAIRFAGPKLKSTLEGYVETIKSNNVKATYERAVNLMKTANSEQSYLTAARLFEQLGDYEQARENAKICSEYAEKARKEQQYSDAMRMMRAAKSEDEYLKAANVFKKMGDYEQSLKYAEDCIINAEEARKSEIYRQAVKRIEQPGFDKIGAYKEAISILERVRDYKDAETLIDDCNRKIYTINEEKQLQKKKIKKFFVAAVPVIVAIIVFIILLVNVIIPGSKYSSAEKLLQEGKYDAAASAFAAIDYKDSADMAKEAKYQKASKLLDSGEYDKAAKEFETILSYKDSRDLFIEALYQLGLEKREAKDWDTANEIFESLGNYKDSKDLVHYHSFKVTHTDDPTCTEDGKQFSICYCGETQTETLKALGHDFVESDRKEATCTDEGYIKYVCSRCKEEKTDTKKSLGHDFKSATCTEPKTCKRCGATQGNALGHTSGGTKCTRCGEITFEKLSFSGTGFKIIKNINIPNGNFVISGKGTSTDGAGGGFYVYVYDSHDKEIASWIEMVYCPEKATIEKSKTFKGAFDGGRIEVQADYNVRWTITVEAY